MIPQEAAQKRKTQLRQDGGAGRPNTDTSIQQQQLKNFLCETSRNRKVLVPQAM